MSQEVPSRVLDEMKTYYRERANEYDEWFYRRGRYDRSAQSNARWFAEADEVFAALDTFQMQGELLELAPGTGIWTERLLKTVNTLTAVDASAEMIAINRARVNSNRVEYIQADLFAWQPERTYDGVFFGFWLSHIPLERLDRFLDMLAAALRPGGKIFFVDGRREPTSTAVDHQLPEEGDQMMTRKLNDGRAFEIVKNFYDPVELATRCAQHGFDIAVRETATYFLYGCGKK
ncbi:MAG TPA: class I SAM-dependent methyltransferase [Ktedonobacteraceae bacterium]|nr:class I SAM-dependent methyltransferase [Ktedonobacteraceae bacterium]